MQWNNVSPDLADCKNVDVVIIGYTSCPYSKRALDALAKRPEYAIKFIAFGPANEKASLQTPDAFRAKFHYDGTFPVIFCREHQGMVYIGGSTELLERLEKSETWLASDAHW
jgi:glutaredoxin